MGGYLVNYERLVLNLFGLEQQYCLGNWYIYFYVYALVLLPLLRRWLQPHGILRPIVAVAIFAMARYICAENQYFDNCFAYSQMLVVGLYCAKTQILTQWSEIVKKRWLWVAILLIAVLMRCVSGAMGITTDVIAVPIAIIAICGLSQGCEQSRIAQILTCLGKRSTYMWFVHCVFFSVATKGVIQSLPIWSNSLPIVFIMVSIMSFIMAYVISRIETLIPVKAKLP